MNAPSDIQLISDYMRDDVCRHMLNALTQKTFGFDFEGWVTQGYFEGDYIPYSFVKGGRIISNVSANRMVFMQNGSRRNYIQIGTVMTDAAFRGQGLASRLMRHVIGRYEKECDGIYLFGDLSALGFYQKLDFRTANQYRYYVKEEFCTRGKAGPGFRPIKDCGNEIKQRYMDLVRKSARYSPFEQMNRFGLQMFYTAGLDDVFHIDNPDCFIVLAQGECTELKSILCSEKVPLLSILRRIEIRNRRCRLGFVPLEEDRDLCAAELYDGGDDYRLFCRGEILEAVERDRLYFPDLSHA
ncbi:MAG: GNAT family N-acetyltransferase [Clostridia bacterium]|nr:GNAT family N-acetyltransferase [Clostridia bacterium]